jgi:CMP-N-acetylneuraminic acid synthetase
MRDRRKELRHHTRQQMASLALDVTTLSTQDIEEALVYLYASNPLRWQRFMDEAAELVRAASTDRSGFPDTTQHGDPDPAPG